MTSPGVGVTTPLRGPAAVASAVLGALVAAAVLVAGMGGNTFSRHVGDISTHGAHAMSAGTSSAVALLGAGGPSPVETSDDTGQHLMHLLGGCVALLVGLGAGLVLALRSAASARCLRSAVRRDAQDCSPRLLPTWLPPPPTPPRLSPVIRT